MSTNKLGVLALLCVMIAISMAVQAVITYDYAWRTKCLRAGGVQLATSGGATKLCVRGPVELIQVHAKPFEKV